MLVDRMLTHTLRNGPTLGRKGRQVVTFSDSL